tara:strand:+ start:252 stop:470 length:219 start_codon:yes stop_codon:yes gene_type:complete
MVAFDSGPPQENPNQYKARVQLTGSMCFDAVDDEAAAAWMTSQENEIGIALINIDGIRKIRNVQVEFIEEAE